MLKRGDYLNSAILALELDKTEKNEAIDHATQIVNRILEAYLEGRKQSVKDAPGPSKKKTGLVYGKIQSGKTRAMICSSALAFDNEFVIVVVLTSNINDLVSQTHSDFSTALTGVMTYTKDTDLKKEEKKVRVFIERGSSRL